MKIKKVSKKGGVVKKKAKKVDEDELLEGVEGDAAAEGAADGDANEATPDNKS